MNFYKDNLLSIEKNKNAFPISIFHNLSESSLSENILRSETKDKKPTASIFHEGKTLSLHSAYNPVKEAETLASEALKDKDVDTVFIFGIGAGYIINAIRKINNEIKIAVIEPNYNYFFTALSLFNLKEIIEDKNIIFFIGENQLPDIETFISLVATKKVQFIANRAYAVIFKEEAILSQKKIFDTVDKKSININTLSRFEKLWAYNISSNAPYIPFHYGCNRFFGKYKNFPAIVISAGPSLEKNIAKLGRAKERAVLIAVDTALKPLSHHNIKPHFIISIDPQKKNSKYFRGVDTSESILIAESSIDREVLDNHKGALFFIDSVFPLAKLFMSSLGERGELTLGGSVSTGALDFAIKLGCENIITVGLDLSFPNHQTHIKGSYHEENFFTQINKLDTYDSRIYKVLTQDNLKKETNVYGETVYIDSRFQMYRNWYEKHIAAAAKEIKFYNATEGGIIISGMENMTFDNVIKNFTKKIDIPFETSSSSSRVNKEEELKIAKTISSKLTEIDKDLAKLAPYLEKALILSENLVSDLKRKRKVDKTLSELEKLDNVILSGATNDYIGITMQKTIKMITEGYDLDESEDKEVRIAQNSRKLYEEIEKAVSFNRYIISKALHNLST